MEPAAQTVGEFANGIVSVIEATDQMRETAEFASHALIEKKSEIFESVVAKQIKGLEAEIAKLERESKQLIQEIEALTGCVPSDQSF